MVFVIDEKVREAWDAENAGENKREFRIASVPQLMPRLHVARKGLFL